MVSSAIGRNRASSGGFTLLELCIVLAVVALIVVAAVPEISSWLAEEKLRSPAREIEQMAMSARAEAIARQHPIDLVIEPSTLHLEEAGAPDGKALDVSVSLPDGTTIRVRPWGEDQLAEKPEARWRFQPDGLCEPFEIELRQGASYIDLTFDPLSAGVAEEKYAFQ